MNACILDEIGSIIATGKESIVLYGKGGKSEQHPMPEEVAIKVYYIENKFLLWFFNKYLLFLDI